MTGRVSVVVPAHDEGAGVTRCLETLLGGAVGGVDAGFEMELIVVANGCTDDTAGRARVAAPTATVLEIAEASKSRALNVGDGLARHFPRVYLDADMQLDAPAIRRLTDLLGGEVLAAGLRSRLVVDRSTWPVRAYLRVWSRLPSVRDGLVGNGVVALSEQGRARFDAFPDAMGDDYFLDCLFPAVEKRVIDGGADVLAPARVRDLIRRKVRVFAGNRQVASSGVVPAVPRGGTGWLTVVRREPGRWADTVVFLAVSVTAKLVARWQLRRGTAVWARDDSRLLEGTGR